MQTRVNYVHSWQEHLLSVLSRVITLPSVKYNGGVETDIFESCHDLGGARQVEHQHVTKITINPEPCMTILLEKL